MDLMKPGKKILKHLQSHYFHFLKVCSTYDNVVLIYFNNLKKEKKKLLQSLLELKCKHKIIVMFSMKTFVIRAHLL